MREKTLFFHVFRATIHKVRESCENSVFWAFCARFREKCEKTVFFSRFSRHFVQSSQKMRNKQRFLSILHDDPSKSVRKQCYFMFLSCCFIMLFQCFFMFFNTLCTKFAKKAKNSVLRASSHDVHTKSGRKQWFFSRFSRHFVQSSQKMRKTWRFLTFLQRLSHKKCEYNSIFSRFFKALCTKFLQKMQKNRVFW